MVTPGESVDRHSLTERWLPSRGHESAAIGPRAVMECHSGLEETPQDPVDVLHLNFECGAKCLSCLQCPAGPAHLSPRFLWAKYLEPAAHHITRP